MSYGGREVSPYGRLVLLLFSSTLLAASAGAAFPVRGTRDNEQKWEQQQGPSGDADVPAIQLSNSFHVYLPTIAEQLSQGAERVSEYLARLREAPTGVAWFSDRHAHPDDEPGYAGVFSWGHRTDSSQCHI